MKHRFTRIAATFLATGHKFDAKAFCKRFGGLWKVRTIPGSTSGCVLYFQPQPMDLTDEENFALAMDFLQTQYSALEELKSQTTVRRLCIQTNHWFAGSLSAAITIFPVELMKVLCDLDIELASYAAVRCDSAWDGP